LAQEENGLPLMCLGDDNATVSFMDFINMKRTHDRRRAQQKDSLTLRNYVQSHRLSCRKVNGKLTSGTYVENEIIAAVCHQNDIIICVAHRTLSQMQVFTPNGIYMHFSEEGAVRSPFFLWCTGSHYQALVKLCDYEVLSTALELPAFKNSRILDATHFRMYS
jgi:hypothetical protein